MTGLRLKLALVFYVRDCSLGSKRACMEIRVHQNKLKFALEFDGLLYLHIILRSLTAFPLRARVDRKTNTFRYLD